MSGRHQHNRSRLVRAMGGERTAVRAEQLRALGLTDRAIARRLQIPVETVCDWFALQDSLVFSDDAEPSEIVGDEVGGAA